MRPRVLTVLLSTFCLATASSLSWAAESGFPVLKSVQLQWLGDQIYRNECNHQSDCLTSWNQGENFPSLGIGHFIWYQAGQKEIYHETFPDLLDYLQKHDVRLPGWLTASRFEQPWPDRDSFLADSASVRQQELRTLLEGSLTEQTAFIVNRFHAAIPGIIAAAPGPQQSELGRRLLQVALSRPPQGIYALIDYVHFKGEGTRREEQYQGQGWGLLQVLQAMPADSNEPLQDFVQAADAVLTRRVANAPVQRNESRWLAGWRNRLNTYLPPAGQP